MMNFFFFIGLFFICFGFSIQTSVPGKYDVQTFTQKVDHFNYLNDQTFQQRVVISQKYQDEENPPIFFYCGNEGNIFAFVNNTGLMWELEDKFKAVLIFVEHRYYGNSFPKRRDSNDYSYLSIEQALADYAFYIDHLRYSKPNFQNSPVIAFGGSYGGMLAAWMRIKYPHILQGAVASSAPILQFPGTYNCSDFNKLVTNDYEDYSKTCANVIRKTWSSIRRLGTTQGGLKFLNDAFKICKPINDTTGVNKLIDFFIEAVVNVAMTDYPNESNFLKPMPRYPMKEICKILETDQLNDPDLVKLFRDGFYSIYLNYTNDAPDCVNIEGDATDLGAEGWNYQSCTETVMPICSNGIDDFFEPQQFDLEKIKYDCKKKYDVQLDPNKVRMEYGLKDLRGATNVIFSNGMRDPWMTGGVLESNYKQLGLRKLKDLELEKILEEYFGLETDKKMTENIIFTNGPIIITIPNACHHEDLRESGEYDPDELLTTRKQETKIIRKWLKDFYKHFD